MNILDLSCHWLPPLWSLRFINKICLVRMTSSILSDAFIPWQENQEEQVEVSQPPGTRLRSCSALDWLSELGETT